MSSSGKVYWSKNKGLTPGAQCLIQGQVTLGLVVQHSLLLAALWPVLLRTSAPAAAMGRDKHELTRLYLLSSDYINLERGHLSFKLTNLLPNSFWACAGHPLSPFLDFPVFQALILSGPFPRFPRLDSSSLCRHFCSYSLCPKVLSHRLASTAHVLTFLWAILASTTMH